MSLYNRQITRIAVDTQTTVITAPASGVFRGLLLFNIANPSTNTTLTATIVLNDGANDIFYREVSLDAGETYQDQARLVLTSTDSIKVTLSATPTDPVDVIASYNDQ